MTRLLINFNFEHPDGSTYNDLFGTLVFIKIHFNLVQVLIVPLNKARPRNSNINIRYAVVVTHLDVYVNFILLLLAIMF